MKKLPIGVSDFKFLVDQDYYYVDKTLLIREIIETSSQVVLIPRPRRFGKTLNLSMLKYFFEQTGTDNSYLFQNTKIWREENCKKFFGEYPVIFLSFKDVKQTTWDQAYKQIMLIIIQEMASHFSSVKDYLFPHELIEYTNILEQRADETTYSNSLLMLSRLLHRAYKKQVIILIDEYDSPIHAAYSNGYYAEMINFMRSLLSTSLKDNINLQKGVLTGILRIAKESIFSDLNNLGVYTLLDSNFQDKFGFTQTDVSKLLNDYQLDNKSTEIKKWYNGYHFGSITIYNPWSLISCVEKHGRLEPYWLNTSSNLLVKKLLFKADRYVKSKLELLISGQPITELIDKNIIFQHIDTQETALWSLLLFTGYLTYSNQELRDGITYCDLVIPNNEIKIIYNDIIVTIFQSTLESDKIKLLAESLMAGNILSFAEILQEFVINSISVFDLPSNEPEKSYHLFILGLLSILQGKYQLRSNRESGFGRYDIMLIPNDKNSPGIIIEFKKTLPEDNNNLELAAQRALAQIKQKHYAQELKALGIKSIKALGIAFLGKKIFVESEDLS